MKIYVSSKEYIQSMAYVRNKIKSTAENYRDDIADHIIKCIVYSKNHKDYKHWIEEEIASWIFNVSDMKPKKGFKIKPSDYDEWLMGGFGDEFSDAKKDLTRFRQKFVVDHKDPFPDFDITEDMCRNLFEVVTQIKKNIIPKVGKYDSKETLIKDLHQILDPNCNSSDWLK